MKSLQRYTCKATLIGLCLAFASGAYADVSSINSAIVFPTWNDVPGATRTYVNTFVNPNIGLISLNESGVSSATGYANRDEWAFSNNGLTAYQFGNNDYFTASMTLTVSGNDTSIDNEGGFMLHSTSVGDIQLIGNSPGAFLGQFGGNNLRFGRHGHLESELFLRRGKQRECASVLGQRGL
jgi:hypothetical protein